MTQNLEFRVEKSEESKKHLGAGEESRIPRPMPREAISRVSIALCSSCVTAWLCFTALVGKLVTCFSIH